MKLKNFEKAFIDELKENLNEGYAIDASLILKSPNSPSRIKNMDRWLKRELIVVYEFIIEKAISVYRFIIEAINVTNKKSEWTLYLENYLRNMETRIKNKLDRPNVRIVYDKRLEDPEKFFREMNPDLYSNLTSERMIGNDLYLLMAADYEKTKVVSFDDEVCRVAFKYNIPNMNTRILHSFPKVKEKKSWKILLSKKIQQEEQ